MGKHVPSPIRRIELCPFDGGSLGLHMVSDDTKRSSCKKERTVHYLLYPRAYVRLLNIMRPLAFDKGVPEGGNVEVVDRGYCGLVPKHDFGSEWDPCRMVELCNYSGARMSVISRDSVEGQPLVYLKGLNYEDFYIPLTRKLIHGSLYALLNPH